MWTVLLPREKSTHMCVCIYTHTHIHTRTHTAMEDEEKFNTIEFNIKEKLCILLFFYIEFPTHERYEKDQHVIEITWL